MVRNRRPVGKKYKWETVVGCGLVTLVFVCDAY
jgi:hypothetical protein